jgi:hypothetical protein
MQIFLTSCRFTEFCYTVPLQWRKDKAFVIWHWFTLPLYFWFWNKIFFEYKFLTCITLMQGRHEELGWSGGGGYCICGQKLTFLWQLSTINWYSKHYIFHFLFGNVLLFVNFFLMFPYFSPNFIFSLFRDRSLIMGEMGEAGGGLINTKYWTFFSTAPIARVYFQDAPTFI